MINASDHEGDQQKDGPNTEPAEKRKRQLTIKALQNSFSETSRKADRLHKNLQELILTAENEELRFVNEFLVKDLEYISSQFNDTLQKLHELREQDKFGELPPISLMTENITLNNSLQLIKKLKDRQSHKLSDIRSSVSGHSRRSKSSSAKSSTSSARLRAIAEAAAARENAEYDEMIAEKELELKRIEAEEEIRRALYRKEVAILTARRKAAAADAKLKAIEEAILNEGASQPPEAPKLPKVNPRERVYEWVQGGTFVEKKHVGHKPEKLTSSVPQRAPMSQAYAYNFNEDLNYPSQLDIKPALTPTSDNYFGSQLIDALTSTNQQIVASLARQSLPKCHPDTFDGNPTLFHPWKASFKAMLRDGNISPEQEINYLLNFTTRDVKRLVDSYRKRLQGDPVVLLRDLWKELERRFGSVAVITNALLERLRQAAKFDEHENTKLQSFADVCADVESQMSHLPGLACLNFPNVINPVVEKLPSSLKQKWEKEVVKYAEENDDRYPGFQRFSKIIQKQAKRKNHPNITAGTLPKISLNQSSKNKASEKRTLVTSAQSVNEQLCKAIKPELYDDGKYCVYHEKEGHTLNECKAFAAKDFDQRTDWVLRAGLCFRCLSEGHRASECTKHITCNVCSDKRHSTPLHKGKISTERVNSNCTALCGGEESGVSCCKMILVDVFDRNSPNKTCRVYAILDDQSNASLISNELADLLEIKAPREMYYLTTCSGYKDEKYGRRVSNLSARSVDGIVMELPSLIECDSIPGDKREIPTPEMARKFHHLRGIASQIPSVDEDAGIHMLIGRDAPEFLKVREFRNGPKGAPWAQKHLLGWTISGQMCLDNVEHPVHVRAHRTTLDVAHDITTQNSYRNEDYEVTPCPNAIRVDGTFGKAEVTDIFRTTKEDNDLSQSLEDKRFLKIMESSTRVNEKGNWEMPLPFKNPEIKMPNNRRQAETRLNGLLKTFDRKLELKADYIAFMGKILSKGHASQVPRDQLKARTGRFFYLSHFPTYHNTKHTIRVVFDSSCEFEGISLNKVLLPGPDLTNNLVGVLMRFRRETVAVMCDIEQMFHSFFVDPSHRDFLRFLWFKDNDLSKPITEYRMNVHLFGNGPSPAIATYGLQKSAIEGRQTHGEEAAQFICRNFYVDDGLVSLPTPQRAINLVKRTQTLLSSANLRLHKVVSNSIDVMEAFSCDDRAKDVRDLDLRHDNLPTQRALGVCWDLEKDAFTFKVSLPEKPFTRRGVLSVVNSVYDPLGLVVPVTLEGKKYCNN